MLQNIHFWDRSWSVAQNIVRGWFLDAEPNINGILSEFDKMKRGKRSIVKEGGRRKKIEDNKRDWGRERDRGEIREKKKKKIEKERVWEREKKEGMKK